MSENSEHSPDDNETEKKPLEEDSSKDISKSEAKLIMNQSNIALLEDEEMPTYISVSSLSRREDSDGNVKQQENVCMEEERSPCPSDDQAASSIYVVSSGDESDQPPYNDEDDEDEYADTDDNDVDSEHRHNVRHLLDDDEDDDDDDEDEEDDEEGPRSMRTDDEDIMNYYDGNYRTEVFDRESADFVLNKPLENHHKERSRSLQDLSIYEKNNQYDQRRHFNALGQTYLNIPQNMMYSVPRRKQSMPSKYHHIQSKVKLYIKDIKEQNKRSAEKHVKDEEDYDTIPDKGNINNENNTEGMKLMANNKIKNYAEETIKELEISEAYDRNKITYNTPQIVLNGQGNKNGLEPIEQSLQNNIQINTLLSIAQHEKNIIKSNEKIQKQNGAAEVSFPEKEDRNFENAMQPSILQNGHPEVLSNLRNMTYDNYMRYSFNPNQKTELNKNLHIIERRQMQSEACNNVETMDISDVDNNDAACQLKNENIKNIRPITDELKNNNEHITFEKTNKEFNKIVPDSVQVTALKEQLNQKTVQYNNLCDVYHKQLEENLKIKQELEELKKSLAKCETNNKSPEQKVASVQTDCILDLAQSKDNNETEAIYVKQSDNKILGNSITSTLSSIDKWTDSACNLSIPMKPPQMAKSLYSDDSIVLADATPKKTTRTLSRAFITSSRILQTLSNITQGKVRSESPLIRNSKRRLNENVTLEQDDDDDSYQNQSSKSKKRKIVDILETSSFLQSFKSSVSESQSKANEILDTESQLNYLSESVDKKLETRENSSNINTSQLANATSTENKIERSNDPDDNVKCFVFHENENSKDRSFLILAEEPAKDKVINEKGRIRECGPYLLGNIEVRMSEINGTINIWGKEVNEESMLDHSNEINTSNKVKDNKKCYCWQKTPYKRFNNSNIACSTNKKSKEPASSNFSCQHSPSFNTKPSCSTDKTCADDSCNPSISPYEDCQSMKHRKEWLKYKRMLPQEKLRSYCNHDINTLEQKYNCSLHKEKQNYGNNHNCNKEKLNSKEHSFSKTSLESTKQSHENIPNSSIENNELICGYNTMQHHFMHDSEEDCQENHKCCNINRNTFTYESLDTNPENNECCNHNSSSMNEEDPLIALKHSSEFSETSRRRLRGRKVRGILMDLLRGCGDICNSNSPNNKNYSYKKKVPHSPNCSSQIKISSYGVSPEPHCSNSVQSDGRCCHAYARIESQLEEFRIQIEKVQSRSDVILDMLYRLHSEDIN